MVMITRDQWNTVRRVGRRRQQQFLRLGVALGRAGLVTPPPTDLAPCAIGKTDMASATSGVTTTVAPRGVSHLFARVRVGEGDANCGFPVNETGSGSGG